MLDDVLYLASMLGLALLIRRFGFLLVRVKGSSMLDTLRNGDVLFVRRIFKPRRHQVVICHYPGRRQKRLTFLKANFVKRIIALPGETIAIVEGSVLIDGEPLTEPFLNPMRNRIPRSMPPIRVPEGCVFVMGDNRDNSHDSRFIGPIACRELVGCAVWRTFPFRRVGRIA